MRKQGLTCQAIGNLFGVTKQRIHQITKTITKNSWKKCKTTILFDGKEITLLRWY